MEILGPDAFDGRTLRRAGRYAVVFAADWCPFCQAFLPQFAKLGEDPKLHVAGVDLTDPDAPLWEQFEVEVVPSVVVFRDGEVTFRLDGIPGVGLGPADVRRIRTAVSA